MIGPNDKRARVTRCEACSRRKIKCHGGFPCDYCTRTSIICVQPKTQPRSSDLVFVHVNNSSSNRSISRVSLSTSISPAVPLDPDSKLSKHFFSAFLLANDFTTTNGFDCHSIARLSQSNSGLKNAVTAIVTLDASRRSQQLAPEKKHAARAMALNAYRNSLASLRRDLEDQNILDNSAFLWSTFLLGIFELMYDVTGEGWVKHILYGTSKILQLRGPAAHASGSGRSFFLTFRVFEVCRALIYNDSTFLDQPGWRLLMEEIWTGSGAVDWHPREALLNLMISCSSLSMRGHALDHLVPQPTTNELLGIVNEGLSIQSSLLSWSEEARQWSASDSNGVRNTSNNETHNSASLVAEIYYHASLIFLSGIFDYRSHHWKEVSTPSLPAIEIQNHVAAILSLSKRALNTTRIAGVLLFFPLRVAGARVRTVEEQQEILSMLHDIESRNFVVAGAFVEDLNSLWASRT
ncbi:hypothetical protein BGZ60DRAFT_402378 [Tricladium varicosporioides]|nr:hypothetical protein BGZ60DRAFT_402378 [Hymenoscyphus varicosporioides]